MVLGSEGVLFMAEYNVFCKSYLNFTLLSVRIIVAAATQTPRNVFPGFSDSVHNFASQSCSFTLLRFYAFILVLFFILKVFF